VSVAGRLRRLEELLRALGLGRCPNDEGFRFGVVWVPGPVPVDRPCGLCGEVHRPLTVRVHRPPSEVERTPPPAAGGGAGVARGRPDAAAGG
jgi:hypothetical protein